MVAGWYITLYDRLTQKKLFKIIISFTYYIILRRHKNFGFYIYQKNHLRQKR